MAEEKSEPTRKELADALAQANKQIAALMAAPAVAVARPAPQKVPYEGLVRATAPCFIGSLRAVDDVWQHKADCLWDDDPYEPCVITREDGKPSPHPNAPKPLPKELRPRTADVMAARGATPLTAAQW